MPVTIRLIRQGHAVGNGPFALHHKCFEHLKLPYKASLVAQRLKHLPPVWETWVRCLGREDPLEKEMATHSSILAWRIPWTEEPGRLQSTRVAESRTRLSNFTFTLRRKQKEL